MSQLDHIPSIRLRAIEVTGPDAIAFMQSQLTIDVAAIADSRLHPAAWCSPDGRADAVLLIGVDGDRVWLVLPEALVAPTLKRARMFSIGRKVALERDVAAYPAVAPPSQEQQALELALDPDRSLLLGKPGDDAGNGAEGLSDQWLQADIECAMAWILPATAGAYLPQMLGLDALGGLSYKKGCFPGQEVIARVHYRGRVTRRTARFRLAADSPPPPGREFKLAEKPAQVLYAVAEPGQPGSAIGLAVVAAEAEDSAKITIGSHTGTLF
ncbi:MAG TPA: hypothetical protein VJ902_08895 [Wenzhouxiangellaceae bacterium]|nr:hypothetical protein [Wenzhouxiangellaceae bacterium]